MAAENDERRAAARLRHKVIFKYALNFERA
jgi:hypothetical protein